MLLLGDSPKKPHYGLMNYETSFVTHSVPSSSHLPALSLCQTRNQLWIVTESAVISKWSSNATCMLSIWTNCRNVSTPRFQRHEPLRRWRRCTSTMAPPNLHHQKYLMPDLNQKRRGAHKLRQRTQLLHLIFYQVGPPSKTLTQTIANKRSSLPLQRPLHLTALKVWVKLSKWPPARLIMHVHEIEAFKRCYV